MNDHIPPMRRRADLEKIALVTCRSELEKVKAINAELITALTLIAESSGDPVIENIAKAAIEGRS